MRKLVEQRIDHGGGSAPSTLADFAWRPRDQRATSGPLAGVRVIELGGIGPGPFCGMLLADMGAEVLRVDRPGDERKQDMILHRGREFATADLKEPADRSTVLRLASDADVLIEGFRPGVAERLGLGPDDCRAVNEKLIYGRMTGYGQDGPLAAAAGHDINYIAVAGALGAIGREAPVPPLNLIGDMGGGGMLLALGIACALFEVRASGVGQVVDASIVDGTALQLSIVLGMLANGRWTDGRGVNTLDGGAPFYDSYRCADGEFIAIGAIEKQFYANLSIGLGFGDDPLMAKQWATSDWPAMKARVRDAVATKSRDEWSEVFADLDACVTPVLTLREAAEHKHNRARGVYRFSADGAQQPTPAPRFSRTPTQPRWLDSSASPQEATAGGWKTR
jgi:alpha-methylacyl-CoA racemase